MTRIPFSGSYPASDVDFLLTQLDLAPTSVEEKEVLIQSGRQHYSEMISEEARPDPIYLGIFNEAWDRSRDRIAGEIMAISQALKDRIAAGTLDPKVSLCSLVRAGAPFGVMLVRELRRIGVDAHHYGISIIRDRGLDVNAMNHVIRERGQGGIVFVDGWTGKGAIRGELDKSWGEMTGETPILVVLADPCGIADISGSHEDWLIPSGILGANVSGLISRTILKKDLIGPNDFHGFVPVNHLADLDVSTAFVDSISDSIAMHSDDEIPPHTTQSEDLRLASVATVDKVLARYEVTNRNRVKPGIAEATRAVLRRSPELVMVRDAQDPDLAGLLHLSQKAGIPAIVDPDLTGPYRAITLIRKTS